MAERVWQWLGKRFEDHYVEPDSDLRLDLDVDSLDWVSLTLALQQATGVVFDEAAIASIESVRDLLRESAAAQRGDTAEGDLNARLSEPEELLDAGQLRWLEAPTGLHARLADLLYALIRRPVRRLWRIRVTGMEHLEGEDSRLIAPNHLSAIDPVVLIAIMDRRRLCNTCWGGWTGLLFNRTWTRLVSRALRVLPVDPDRSALNGLALGAAALARGCDLVWFPEGGRSQDGRLGPFRPGIGNLALSQSVSVVPTRIEGSREVLPPGSVWPRLHPISVRFGEPVTSGQLEDEGEGDSPESRIADALRERIQKLAV